MCVSPLTQPQRGGAGEEPFTYLARSLDRIRTAILTQLPPEARANVELEARLGVFCHGTVGWCGVLVCLCVWVWVLGVCVCV